MEILGPSPQPSFLRLLAILLGEAIECTVLSPNPSHDAVFSPGYPTAGVCYSPLLFSNGFLKLPLSIRLLCAEQNCVCVCVHVHLVVHLVVFNSLQPPWTAAHQAPLSMEFPRQEYWSGLPFPYPGDPPNPKIKSVSPTVAGGFFTTAPSGKLEQD